MSALTPQKSGAEQHSTAFSYAQAAKGRSPSVPNSAQDAEKPTAKRTASEGQAASVDDFKAQKISDAAAPAKIDTNKTSPPSSQDDSTASASTLLKDEDPFVAQNGSSESTWDKLSQDSQNGIRDSDKTEPEKRDSDTTSWADDTPASAPASLRDAPPPAVNFWEQRKELLQAKVKATKPATATHSVKASDSSITGDTTNNSKTPGHTNDARRLDAQKKSKVNPNNTEGNAPQTGTRDWVKAPDKGKNADDGLGKNAPKNARGPESAKSSAPVSVPLPPPGDAVFWPTPDSAQDEEKRRSQERADRAEKDKMTVPKPNSKKEWTALPFVPSAVFNTPIPQSRRGGGGRPSRGARENGMGRGAGVPQASNGAEKAVAGAQGSVAPQHFAGSNERSRAEPSIAKPPPTGSKSKRSVSAGPPVGREQRRAGDSISTERRKEVETKGPRSNVTNTSAKVELNGISTSTQTANGERIDPTTSTGEIQSLNGKFIRDELQRADQRPSDAHAHPRSYGGEKRYTASGRVDDPPRDVYDNPSYRERGEGQRGRGAGYRNRNSGGHASNTPGFGGPQSFINGQASHHQLSAMAPTKSHSGHERHVSQSPGLPYVQPQPHQRSYRSSSRSQSIPHPGPPYGRYPNGPYTGPPNLPNIQTDVANTYGYQPGHQGIMSAMPFSSFSDQTAMSVYSMVSMQMEYYFSVDNLCKDLFLRKHMDSQGYVFLSVVMGFNRIKQLTQDIELIRLVCLHSTNIEIRTAADGIDRLRKKDGWKQWVFTNMEDRDPSAQNDGPEQVEQLRVAQPSMFCMPFGYDGASDAVTPYGPPNHLIGDSPNYQLRNGTAPSFVPAAAAPTTNGNMSGTPVTQTPLSAAVPDFAPSLPQTNGQSSSPLESSSQSASTFTDEQVQALMILLRKRANPSAPPRPPFASAASRTFSNGSIDGRTMNEEILKIEERQPRSKVNGTMAPGFDEPDIVHRSRSPFSIISPMRNGNSKAPPVFWVKDKGKPIDSLPNELTHESYNDFRANALQQREQSASGTCHYDMDILYQFWSHFLVRNFNAGMYEEFRRLALDDANKRGSNAGMTNLVQYYDASMLGTKVISDELARDFVDLVLGEETNKDRPAFDKLRAAWRNGATNMKNRKKIDNIVDANLKAQLER